MSFSSKNAKPCSPSSMSAPPCRAGTAAIGRRECTIARCASCSRCTTRRFNSWRISALPPSLDNFAGLRIGGGPRGGTSGAYVEHIFKVLGIPALVHHGAWDDLGQQLAERELDGAVAAIGAPFPALARLEQTVDFIAPSREQIAGIR